MRLLLQLTAFRATVMKLYFWQILFLQFTHHRNRSVKFGRRKIWSLFRTSSAGFKFPWHFPKFLIFILYIKTTEINMLSLAQLYMCTISSWIKFITEENCILLGLYVQLTCHFIFRHPKQFCFSWSEACLYDCCQKSIHHIKDIHSPVL